MPDGELVLIVEDDPSMARIVAASLGAHGYTVRIARTGAEALEESAERPAVVILDLGLPDLDGVEVCRVMRQTSVVPIIVISADGAEDRKIGALDEGADDYVTKPFSMPELLARVRVALRHRQALGPFADDIVLVVGDLVIDTSARQVTVAGHTVDLTPKEFDILAFLARHRGKVLTHRAILEQVWGPEATDRTEYLRTYTNQLRKKLHHDASAPRLVTEPGVGYRLIAQE
jgi:two-component system KDP operon response regulator KdpE